VTVKPSRRNCETRSVRNSQDLLNAARAAGLARPDTARILSAGVRVDGHKTYATSGCEFKLRQGTRWGKVVEFYLVGEEGSYSLFMKLLVLPVVGPGVVGTLADGTVVVPVQSLVRYVFFAPPTSAHVEEYGEDCFVILKVFTPSCIMKEVQVLE
jgi:hypothetical protein